MTTRMFKPGDRVVRKTGGKVMIVQRYVMRHSILGSYESPSILECSWYDKQGFHKEAIHQNALVKASNQRREIGQDIPREGDLNERLWNNPTD